MRTTRSIFPLPLILGLLLPLTLACDSESEPGETPQTPSAQIDHVIVAVGDLDSGIAQFEELTGVRPTFGGDHPGRGTRNALVSLGPRTYLEILAPQEGVEAIEDAPGLHELTELTPWGWAASTDDLQETFSLLRANGYQMAEPAAGSRATPAGGLLTWIAGMVQEPVISAAPFFIEWGEGSPHPATTSPTGCELETWTVLAPDPSELESFLDAVGLASEVEALAAEPEGYRLTLRCPKGRVTFQ
jgi:hypothetical protein